MIKGKVFLTGGSGTLGKAIIHVAQEQNWPCEFTIYSTDVMKHKKIQRVYPEVNSVVGDICDYGLLEAAIAGHDVVIHAAAVKHIPASEENVSDTLRVNVDGSEVVAKACVLQGIPTVIGISTDKACGSHNLYGSTKFILEKLWQEYHRIQSNTNFYLLRYGNVVESTGNVVEAWKNLVRNGYPIKITNPEMTRFWLSPQQAVSYITKCLSYRSGDIFVPQLKSLSIGQLAEYVVPGVESERIPIRPGEKIHETLVTEHEIKLTRCVENGFLILPSLHGDIEDYCMSEPFTSQNAIRLTKEEFDNILSEAKIMDEVYG